MKALRIAWVVVKCAGIVLGWAVTYMAIIVGLMLAAWALAGVFWLADQVIHVGVIDYAVVAAVVYGGYRFYNRYLWSFFR